MDTLTHPLPLLGIALLGAGLTAYAVWRLVRLVRASVLLRRPLVPEQTLELPVAGPVQLHFEGPNRSDVVGKPRLGRAYRGLTWTVVDPATGRALPTRRTAGPRVAGRGRARLGLLRFEAPRPGEFRLEIGGLGPEVPVDDCAVVLTRPCTLALTLWILAIVAGSLLLLGGLLRLVLGP